LSPINFFDRSDINGKLVTPVIFYQLDKKRMLILGQLITPGNVKRYSVQRGLPDAAFRKVSYFHQLLCSYEKHFQSPIRVLD
jgi:hypothetical protein